jgi:hypothetical protein
MRSVKEPKPEPEIIALKEKWGAMVEQQEISKDLAKKINEQAPKIREEIGKLIYEGRFTDKAVSDLLVEKKAIESDAVGDCMVCTVCTACTGCLNCAVCVVTGVVVAVLAGFTVSTASVASHGA